MTASQPDTRSLSPIAQEVAECYAVVYPEAPSRTKVMQWLNRARKATTGIKGLTSSEFSEAITELVDAGILEPSIEGRKGVASRGSLARRGVLTRFCFCLTYLVNNLQPFNVFAKTADAVNPDGQHQLVTARGLIFQGALSKALSLIQTLQRKRTDDKITQLERQSMLALIALITGDDALAIQRIETTRELDRSGTRKRILYPDIFCFSLALFALIRIASTESRSLYTD